MLFSKALTESINYTLNNRNEALDIAYKTIGSLNIEQRNFWKEVLDATLNLIVGNVTIGTLNVEKYINMIDVLYMLNFIKSKVSPQSILYFVQ